MLKDLAARLRARESEIDSHCEESVNSGFKAIALAFEQGDDLIEAKSNSKHGDWEDWLSLNFTKSVRRAQEYIQFSKNVPKARRAAYLLEAKSIRKAFEIAGIIPELPASAVNNLPTISLPPFVQKLNWLAEYYEKNPPDFGTMQEVEREELKTKLKPIIEIYEKL